MAARVDYERIYRDHADQFDRLVSAEDCDSNLLPAITAVCPVRDRLVLDVGAGTGRLTRLLMSAGARVLALEREPSMIHVARQSLTGREPCLLGCADARALPVASGWADLAIAGWVFGHLRYWLPDDWHSQIGAAVSELERAIKPGGRVVIIETLGTGHATPRPPSDALAEYYAWLETERGFTRQALRTDYQFASPDEAEQLCGFFFGDELAAEIRSSGLDRVPECTGLWWR